MNAIEFGHFIAQQRKAVGLTQKELAERLLVTDKAVSRWENGHGYPDIETLEDLSKALEISLVELMHSKRNEADTVTIQEASESISSAISINAESRHHERCITLILFADLCIAGNTCSAANRHNHWNTLSLGRCDHAG